MAIYEGWNNPIDGEMGMVIQVSSKRPTYEGDYTVIPSDEDQVLETARKEMKENLTVEKVPYHEVSNEYGTTVSILS